jgi:hypothetical protein
MTDPVAALAEHLAPIRLHVGIELRELGSALAGRAAAGRKKRRRSVLVGGASAVLLAVGGTAVAAGGAHTGLFGQPGFTENDTSEYLDVLAPDFREVALSYAKGVDFAPGYSAETYLGLFDPAHQQAQVLPELRGRGIRMQASGVKGTIEQWAFCSWARTSMTDADALGHMRAIAKTDAMAATNQRNYNLQLVEQAAARNTLPLDQYVQINCPAPTPWTAP